MKDRGGRYRGFNLPVGGTYTQMKHQTSTASEARDVTKRIAYLLHRFPAITDTFIKREIRSLQKAGTHVEVISVWKPRERETTPSIMSEWKAETHFVLPRPIVSIVWIVLTSA